MANNDDMNWCKTCIAKDLDVMRRTSKVHGDGITVSRDD